MFLTSDSSEESNRSTRQQTIARKGKQKPRHRQSVKNRTQAPRHQSLPFFQKKKKKKEEENLRNSLKEGDKITTIGGIVGKIVDIKGDNIVIETSMDRVRMELAKWSVMTNNTAQEAAQKARAEAQAAAKEKAAAKKAEKERKKNEKKNGL